MNTADINNITTQDEARQFAIDWQNWQADQNLSFGEVVQWQNQLERLAIKFDLIHEFEENGIF